MRSLLTILCVMAPLSASAYYLETRGAGVTDPLRYTDGDAMTPDTIDVEFRVNPSTFPAGVDAVDAAIRAAFAAWTSAECSSLAFTEGAESTSTDRTHWTADAGAVYVLVYFTDSNEEWTDGPAVGHFWFGHDGMGRLIGASVVLNTRDHAWATDGSASALDVQAIVTALIGRSLGITSAMEGNATLPRYAPGDTSKRELGPDDRAAVEFLYPGSGAGCGMPPAPEAVCDGTRAMPGEPECPPRPTTMPGDGGTSTGRDAGTPPPSDAGMMQDDGGTTTSGGGCGCRVAGGSTRAPAWLAAALAALCVRRRRKAR